MSSCCICYTTDPGYLLPSFVSAIQARRHTSVPKTDVAIYSFGANARIEQAFDRACQAEGIQFVPVSLEVIDGASAMLARLFLDRYVASDYDQFLYIDGDTQITGSLDPLIGYDVPKGQFLAASDPLTFAIPGQAKHDRDISDYFASLGISPGEALKYFNTGVLRINRDGWEALGSAAWSAFQTQQTPSRFPDQDVLNIVGAGQRVAMSLAWNFPIFLCNGGVEEIIQPRIYHFMGSPKPWHGTFLPWSSERYQPYLEIIQKYPELADYLPVMPRWKKFRYVLQQQYKKRLETATWRNSNKRLRILNYEDSFTAGADGLPPVCNVQTTGVI